MQIHLVRHGETDANKNGRLQGIDDTPLTQYGKEVALDTAHALTSYEYEVIYSSPLKRALDTAKLFAQELKTDVRVAPALKEICYGNWEGRAKDELQGSDIWSQRKKDKYRFTHPGDYNGIRGESYADIFGRVSEFLEQLRNSDRESVLLVTHLGVLRNAKKYFEGCSGEDAVSFTPGTDQVYVATLQDEKADTTVLDLS